MAGLLTKPPTPSDRVPSPRHATYRSYTSYAKPRKPIERERNRIVNAILRQAVVTGITVAIFFAPSQAHAAERVRRVIYHDDLETTIRGYGIPFSADHLEALYMRVQDTGVTTYCLKVVEFDNKNPYVGNKKGIDWSETNWSKFPEHYDIYRQTTEFLRKISEQGRPIFNVCIDACRKMDIECFATFRMNDWHGGAVPLDSTTNPDVSFWLKEHPQYAMVYGKPIFMVRDLTDKEFEQLSPNLTDFVARTLHVRKGAWHA